MIYLSVFCIVLYHVAEGITEAMTWLGRTQAIAPGVYHRYRLMEGVGIVGAMVGAYGIARPPAAFGMLLVGAWLIGWAAYEAAYTNVGCGRSPIHGECADSAGRSHFGFPGGSIRWRCVRLGRHRRRSSV